MFYTRILFAIALILSPAYGQWSSESLKSFHAINSYASSPTPHLITLWGGVKRYFNGSRLKGSEFKASLPGFQKKLGLYVHKAPRKAKLVIFLPGIFGTHEGAVSPWLLNGFEDKGFHTASIPNFLSAEYIAAGPQYSAENAFDFDPRSVWEAAQEILAEVGEERVKSIVLVGESLGGYLLGAAAKFAKDYPGVFNKLEQAIFLWPPLNLKRALDAFDQAIAGQLGAYESCNYLIRLPLFANHFWWRDLPGKMDKRDEECFSAFLFHGAFLRSMAKAEKAIPGQRYSERSRNFGEFIGLYNPHFKKILSADSEELNLEHWLKLWRMHEIEVKLASSVDDFINDPKHWESIAEKHLFGWGEHCAPIAHELFIEALTKEAQ